MGFKEGTVALYELLICFSALHIPCLLLRQDEFTSGASEQLDPHLINHRLHQIINKQILLRSSFQLKHLFQSRSFSHLLH